MDLTPSLSQLQSTLASSDAILNPTDALAQSTALTTTSSSLLAPRASLLFIDSTVEDYQSLMAGAVAGTEVHLLNSAQDAVSQITNTLLGREGISSIHIVSHGQSGGLNFANGLFNLSSLPEYATQIQSWSQALTDDADILLYGCNVAQGELGQAFVQILSQLSGADVAASNDLTGSASQGGDWTLEVNTGNIESGLAFQSSLLESYQSILPIGPSGGYIAASTPLQSIDLVAGAPGVLNTGLAGDDPTPVAINLGTSSFRFFGQDYTGANQLFVSVNGLITFGSGTNAWTNTDFTSTPSQAAIGVAWDDWLATNGGSILYQFRDLNSDGTNDQLVIEWSAVPHYSAPSSGDATFQAILQLNTGSSNGNIIFNYPDMSILGTSVDEIGSATIGIKAAGTQGSNLLVISRDSISPFVGTGRAILLTGNTPLLDLNGDQSQATSGVDYRTGFAPGGGPVSIVDGANLSLADPDSTNLASATITLTNHPDGGSEVLSALTTGTNISANYDSNTGVLTLSGLDTVLNYQQVLRTVTYNNTAVSPNTANRIVTFVVSDGANTSPTATSTIGINAPLLDLNGGGAPGINYTTFFPTGGAAVGIVDSANLTLTDPDNTNLSSATVTITNLRNGAFEVLAADTTGTSIVASYNTSTGALTLSGSDTTANYQQVLRSITYVNTAASPDIRDRLISFTVNDGTNNSPTATTTLKYGNPPAKPVLDLNGSAAGNNYSGTFLAGQGVVAVVDSTGLTLTDADSTNLSSATVTITNPLNGASEVLAANTIGTNIASNYNSVTGVLTLSGVDTVAHYQQVLRTVTYNNTAVSPDTTDRTISFVANDGILNSSVVNTTLSLRANNFPTGTVTITGTIQENQPLTVDTSGLSDADGLGTFSYQWQQSTDGVNWTNVTGATNVNFTPGDAQVGQRLRVQVSYTDGQGTTESVFSTATATSVTNVNDAPTGTIIITGTIQENQPLTVDTSGLSDGDGLGTFSYQWQQSTDGVNWTNVTGATNVNFTPGDAQVGQRLRVQVSYTDGQGTAEGPLFSTATATAVTNVNDAPTGSISITGTVQENQTLTADTSGLSDGDGLGTFSYQWQQSIDGVNWTNVTGATNVNFTPGDAQVGQRLRVQVSYTDGQGSTEAVFSTATATSVSNINDAPTGTISITGTGQENQTLSVNTSGLSDADGLGTFSYQWQESTDGVTWTNVTGATNASFTPDDAQVGKQLRARISYTDGQGTTESVFSNATALITGVNDAPTLNAPASIAVTENTATSITGITFNDVDAGTGVLTATFSIPVGTLTATSGSGVTVGGTATNLTLSGTLAAINAFITAGSLKYTTAANSLTAQTLNVIINDNGTGGTGGSLTANTTINLPVTPQPPAVSISNVSHSEGTRGTKAYTFTVTLSKASNQPITIGYGTTDGTAKVSDNDYVAANGTLTFNPGDPLTKTFTVMVNGDSKLEATENFQINLALVSGTATIANGTALGIIGDDDGNGIDINLDGKVDSFWRNSPTGNIGLWFMNGTAPAPLGVVSMGSVSSDWRMEATGDLNDDGVDDFVWHNTVTSQAGVWLMNQAGGITSLVNLGSVAADWRLEKVGDFDGDNKVDMFWRNTVTGDNGIWLMNGTSIQGVSAIGKADVSWELSEVGDFDGDGDLDLLWRNRVSGAVGIWNLNNASFGSMTALGTASTLWSIADVADLDGDGDLDILWNSTSTGDLGIWQMNNSAVAPGGYLGLPRAGDGWRVQGLIDIEGDGKLEIFWRHLTLGSSRLWQMNGVNYSDVAAMPPADPSWSVYLKS